MKYNLEVIQAQIQLARLEGSKGEGSETNGSKSGKHAPRAPAYKLSSFNDKLADLDSFFELFEKQCAAFGVPEGERVNHLYSIFSGKYPDTLVNMEAGSTYSQERDKMLRTYNLTSHGYRDNFLVSNPLQVRL